MEEILERTGASVTSKGVYIPPGKKVELGERRLYLLIEGENEMVVKQAKLEIQRVLDEETLRVGSSGSGATATAGRYSVI
jgi:ATP-dependent RNA helicase DDX46/PRP5